MKRAVISSIMLTLCVASCVFLSVTLSHSAGSFSDMAKGLCQNCDDSESAAVIYNDLCRTWRESEGFFIFLSGRRHTYSIEESLERIGAAIEYQDLITMKTEAAALSAQFTEIRELSVFKSENLL